MISAWTSSPDNGVPAWFAEKGEQVVCCSRHRERQTPIRRASLYFERPAFIEFGTMLQLGSVGVAALKAAGHDGAITHGRCPWGVESDIYVVFCPIQIEWE